MVSNSVSPSIDGLHPTLIDRIDNLGPNNDHIESWFKVAQEQWQPMELKCELQRSQSRPMAPLHAVLPMLPAAYHIPMDIDAS